MALNWCFNDCWPTAANNSIIEYPTKPKTQAYNSIQKSCRPVCFSARFKKFSWMPAETFEADLFVLNDDQNGIVEGTIEAKLFIDGLEYKNSNWDYPATKGADNIEGPRIRFKIPKN